MFAVEIGIRVDHFGLDPQAEIHAQGVNFVDQRLEAVGKLVLIDVPVAEAGVVVLALAKPAVVHHEAIDADGGGFFRERDLAGFIDVEFRCLPRVVNHGTRLGVRRLGQDVGDFKAMQQPRRAAQSVMRNSRRRKPESQDARRVLVCSRNQKD